jgi:hypothetical protein
VTFKSNIERAARRRTHYYLLRNSSSSGVLPELSISLTRRLQSPENSPTNDTTGRYSPGALRPPLTASACSHPLKPLLLLRRTTATPGYNAAFFFLPGPQRLPN